MNKLGRGHGVAAMSDTNPVEVWHALSVLATDASRSRGHPEPLEINRIPVAWTTRGQINDQSTRQPGDSGHPRYRIVLYRS